MASISFEEWLTRANWPWNGDMNRARDLWVAGVAPENIHVSGSASPPPPKSPPDRGPEPTCSCGAGAYAAPETHAARCPVRLHAEKEMGRPYPKALPSFDRDSLLGYYVEAFDAHGAPILRSSVQDGVRAARDWFRERRKNPDQNSLAKKVRVIRLRRGGEIEEIETWTKARTNWHRD